MVCGAEIVKGVPAFLKGTNSGWVDAGYNLTAQTEEEVIRSLQGINKTNIYSPVSGRDTESSRLLSRVFRDAVDLKALGEQTVQIHCEAFIADGSTRVSSINAGFLAMKQALASAVQSKTIQKDPLRYWIAAVPVGLYKNQAVVDMDYAEDSDSTADMNFIMTRDGGIIEVHGGAEKRPMTRVEFMQLFSLAEQSKQQVVKQQEAAWNKETSEQNTSPK